MKHLDSSVLEMRDWNNSLHPAHHLMKHLDSSVLEWRDWNNIVHPAQHLMSYLDIQYWNGEHENIAYTKQYHIDHLQDISVNISRNQKINNGSNCRYVFNTFQWIQLAMNLKMMMDSTTDTQRHIMNEWR